MNLDSNSFTKVLSTTITTNCKCMDTILCFQYLCRITYLYTIVSSCLLGCISDPNTLSFESWEPKCIASEPSRLFIDHHYNCIPTKEIGLTPRKTLGWSSFDCSICRYKRRWQYMICRGWYVAPKERKQWIRRTCIPWVHYPPRFYATFFSIIFVLIWIMISLITVILVLLCSRIDIG